jgi:hypothetical protein
MKLNYYCALKPFGEDLSWLYSASRAVAPLLTIMFTEKARLAVFAIDCTNDE